MHTKDNEQLQALFITFIVHVVILLFLFIFVLRTPIPPFGGGQGVVLNLGYVDEGSGEIQTYNTPSESPNNAENKPDEPNTNTTSEQPNENNQEQPNTPTDVKDNYLTQENNNVDVKAETTPENTPVPSDIKKPLEKTKNESTKENPKIESEKTPNNPSSSSAGKAGETTDGGNNNGDKADKIGDQGNPQGKIDARALYGNPGTGGDGPGGSGAGSVLDMAGWKWQSPPRVKDEDENENGKIVFEITIDSEGEIISIKTLQKTVSPATEKIYRTEVEKLTFVKTDNQIPAAISKGRITFIIRSR